MKFKYRPDIDGLRALSVFFVILYHAFPSSLRGGFVGVDIFFVISGYLITSIVLIDIKNDSFTYWKFYQRRILRIFPALLLVMTFLLLAGWLFLFSSEFLMVGKHIFGGATFVSNIMFYFESGYWDVDGKVKPLLHLWSLGVEEQFYLFLPFFACYLHRKNLKFDRYMLYSVLILLVCGSTLVKIDKSLAFYFPVTRFWEILVGSVIAATSLDPAPYTLTKLPHCVRNNWNSPIVRNALALIGLALIIYAATTLQVDKKFPGYRALAPVSGAAFLIISGPDSLINKYIFSLRPLVFIGCISYPLYLWHWPLLSIGHILQWNILAPWVWTGIRWALIVLSFALAFVTWHYVERRIRFGTSFRNAKALVLLACMFGMAWSGYNVYTFEGFPRRPLISANQLAFAQLRSPTRQDETSYSYAPEAPRDSGVMIRFTSAGTTDTIALFGDSHALSAFNGIAQVNKENGVNTFCISRDASNMPILSQMFDDNNRYKKLSNDMIDIINDHKDISSVFIFSIGPWIYDFYSKSSELKQLKLDVSNGEIFEAALQIVVDKFVSRNKKVFIIYDNPNLPKDMRCYLSRPLKPDVAFDMFRDSYLQRDEEYSMALAKIENATIINTVDLYCPEREKTCRQFDDNGLPLYRDAQHLSDAGSLFLARNVLAPFMRSALR